MKLRIWVMACAVAATSVVAATAATAADTEPYSGGEVTQTTLAVVPTVEVVPTVLGTMIEAEEQLPKTGSSLVLPAVAGLALVLLGVTVVAGVRRVGRTRD